MQKAIKLPNLTEEQIKILNAGTINSTKLILMERVVLAETFSELAAAGYAILNYAIHNLPGGLDSSLLVEVEGDSTLDKATWGK